MDVSFFPHCDCAVESLGIFIILLDDNYMEFHRQQDNDNRVYYKLDVVTHYPRDTCLD